MSVHIRRKEQQFDRSLNTVMYILFAPVPSQEHLAFVSLILFLILVSCV